MKNGICVRKSNNMIHFYLILDRKEGYLFSQRFTWGVWEYFRKGVSIGELYGFSKWKENHRLNHTIGKCLNPSYRRCAIEEMVLEPVY